MGLEFRALWGRTTAAGAKTPVAAPAPDEGVLPPLVKPRRFGLADLQRAEDRQKSALRADLAALERLASENNLSLPPLPEPEVQLKSALRCVAQRPPATADATACPTAASW